MIRFGKKIHGKILASYLNGLSDPQRGYRIEADQEERIDYWAEGIIKQKLQGVLFHDCLSENFCQQYWKKSKGSIVFEKCKPSVSIQNNDYRFFLYLQWLANNPCDAVFMTDLFDVKINMNPFDMVRKETLLWASTEPFYFNSQSEEGIWMQEQLAGIYGKVPSQLKGTQILNVGAWGGWYVAVLRALILLTEEIRKGSKNFTDCIDMSAFNFIIRNNFDAHLVWAHGSPFNSVFKGYQLDSKACFIHK